MAQHDYNIANQTFPATRTDLNNALSAVATNNSGTAAPSTTFANQWFYETDTNLLQIRNEDNDAYITIAELDQTNDTVEYFKADSIRTALIEFTDGDDAITIADGGACTFSGNISVSSTVLGSSDLNLTSADGNEKITLDASGTIRFHAGGSEEMRLTTTGLGIGTASPSVELHVKNSSTDAQVIIQGGSTDANTKLMFYNSAGSERGRFLYDTDGNFLQVKVNTSEFLRIHSSGAISSNAETNPDVSRGGLCLNQGTNDINILTFKSDDVAHGITDFAETDTYGHIVKNSAGSGGLKLQGFMETISAVVLRSFHVNENTVQATSGGDAAFLFDSCVKNGTTVTGNNDSANMACFRDNTIARVFITGDGDVFSDRSFHDSAFDHYDDAHLVRAFDLSNENRNGVIDSKFDDFIKYNAQKLADLRILGKNTDGTPSTFVNINGLQRLHNGAIWQQYEKHQKLANAMYELAKAAVGEDKANEILEQNEIQLLN